MNENQLHKLNDTNTGLEVTGARITTLLPDEYVKVQDAKGKWQRKLVYQPLFTVEPPTNKEELLEFYQLFNDSENSKAVPMAEAVGAEIDITDVVFKPYVGMNEDTGEDEHGVLTYLFDTTGSVFVTSSKSVNISLKNMFALFGVPSTPDYLGVKVKIVKKQGRDRKYTDVVLVP